MIWYFFAWSIIVLLCVLTGVSELHQTNEHLKVLRMFSGGWTTTDEEIMRRGEG